jgi:inhibitor of cysteine peptidase
MATVQLTAADSGGSVSLAVGDELVVRLAENPTTGYRWEIDRADPVLSLADDRFRLAEQPFIGSGGTRELGFRAVATGAGRLELKHRQAWEGDASITNRFVIDVQVAA